MAPILYFHFLASKMNPNLILHSVLHAPRRSIFLQYKLTYDNLQQ